MSKIRTSGMLISTKHNTTEGNPVFDLSSEDGVEVASVYLPIISRSFVADYYKVQKENANFIVTAWNAHDDLVKALKAALAYNDAAMSADGTGQFSWANAARAALAKAGAA